MRYLINIKNFLVSIFLDNKIADNEMRVMYGWEPDESKKE